MDMLTEYPQIHVISPAGFDSGSAQTPGSVRLAAVAPQLGIQSALWGSFAGQNARPLSRTVRAPARLTMLPTGRTRPSAARR